MSKTIIGKILGIPPRVVADRREALNAPEPKSGRPKKLDPYERGNILNLWNRLTGTNAQRILAIHYGANIDFTDIWSVVEPLIDETQSAEQKTQEKNV